MSFTRPNLPLLIEEIDSLIHQQVACGAVSEKE